MSAVERQTICFPHHGTQNVLQHGSSGFRDELRRLYTTAENNALEQLIDLKRALRLLPKDEFWGAVTEGMSRLLGAEICFVMKRVLVDDQESAVEMPPHGEPGSCMMAAALHYCAHDGSRSTSKATKFHAYACPCAYMRHDKVFVVPDRLGEFFSNNPNKLPTACEAYIALPLFEEGKCFAHFGVMWSTEGALRRQLSWAFTEMLLHSLEDMISQRFMEGADFTRPPPAVDMGRVIPHDAVTVAQSLRPYAGSLSHELRTPMQGIVGMLDVMYATVQEAVETQSDPHVRKVFQVLKDNIEIVQDSSRRAVEAADNVVHAYDMDMSIPDAPEPLWDDSLDSASPFSAPSDRRPEILVAGSNLPLSRPNKRRRDEAFPRHNGENGVAKVPRYSRTSASSCRCGDAGAPPSAQHNGEERLSSDDVHNPATVSNAPFPEDVESRNSMANGSSRVIAPGLRHTNLRDVLQYVINEGLKVGGRPDSATVQETDYGEIIEVRTRGSDGNLGQKTIEWSIDPSVPTTLFVDEKDLSKLISCVFLNAIKFTDRSDGSIHVQARMSSRNRYISIRIADNGPGIPATFLPRLFTAFSQGNASITRPSEGLGLGLMVAKGIARKLGGDLTCTKAETNGDSHGTEFEMKIPLHAGEIISRPGSPYGSPLPRRAQPAVNVESPQLKPLPVAPSKITRALHEVVSDNSFFHHLHHHQQPQLALDSPLTPPSPRSSTATAHHHDDDLSTPSSLPSPPVEEVQPVRPPLARPRPRIKKSVSNPEIDRNLAHKYPLTILVAEDNKINRKLLVSMLAKFGYTNVLEAHDGSEAVRQMSLPRGAHEQVDVVLMDLWMPLMDGYEATERILSLKGPAPLAPLASSADGTSAAAANATSAKIPPPYKAPTVLAVTADVTDAALERAAQVGMKGFMTKPYKLHDLQRLIEEYCATTATLAATAAGTTATDV